MGIYFEHNIKIISENEFHKIDYIITGLAFKIHNEIGRLWNEKIYQQALANMCREAGFKNVKTEAEIIVSHNDFEKKYFIDLLVEDSIVYELKTVNKLSAEHRKQALNYLYLLGIHHGKLINFKPETVEKEFASTSISRLDRYEYSIISKSWLDLDKDSIWLKEFITELLRDWGSFLELNLFYEAIIKFRGGEENVIQKIDVIYKDSKLGMQKVHLLNNNIGFKITAFTKEINNYEHHLQRLINLTKLDAIQWINFKKNIITFKTILNKFKK